MSPPIVNEETRPSSHKTIKMTATVSSILPLQDQQSAAQRSARLAFSISFSAFCLIWSAVV